MMAGKSAVLGGEELISALAAFREDALERLRRALAASADEVRTRARKSMEEPKSGRVYRLPGGGRRHQASAPGEAPAVATGRLRAGVGVRLGADGLGATVGVHDASLAGIAANLEFGTRTMAARPWLVPALEAARPEAEKRFREALAKAARKAAARGRSR